VSDASRAAEKAGENPAEIRDEDSLILHAGQLLQTSKQRPDGWAFGSVVFDPMDDRPPIAVDGISTQAGWFPLGKTDLPTPAQLEELQKVMGGEGAADALKPPGSWAPLKDPTNTEYFTLPEGEEKNACARAFLESLAPYQTELGVVEVVEVQRIQNMSMWQSYAVKRQTIVEREQRLAEGADGGGGGVGEVVGGIAGVIPFSAVPFGAVPFGGQQDKTKSTTRERQQNTAARMERVWLFHGTDEETVPKITSMGFNRSFCGKNATVYGKGVYFARDSGYSARRSYAKPNGRGIQHMFLVRVTVGEYCLGKRDALTPDVRAGHKLYDSTVNDVREPVIFVTYHDAQAYPEYLVKFTQHR